MQNKSYSLNCEAEHRRSHLHCDTLWSFFTSSEDFFGIILWAICCFDKDHFNNLEVTTKF